LSTSFAAGAEPNVTPAEARAIAKEAYTYGFPLVDNYRIMFSYWVDKNSPEYKGPINTIQNTSRVYGPEDTAIQTPNSDTPYSFAWLDLRAEPMVLTLPAIEKGRYYSVQMIDAYTYNFDYLGTRTTGNDGGNFIVVGPNWNGHIPKGIKKVLRAEGGIADGQKALDQFRATLGGKSEDLFGTRAFLKNDYVRRAVGTQVGIGANSKEEALYPIYDKDASGQPLDGATGWPAPGSEDTELGVLMEPEVGHGEAEVYARVQA
jgi:hypothetical protein